MSDRLTELQRQRALAQEQLAWLDREIARESGQALPAASAPERGPAATPRSATAGRGSDHSAARPPAGNLAHYQQPGPTPEENGQRGSFIFFFLAPVSLCVFSAGALLLHV